jgi:hypothetical protein
MKLFDYILNESLHPKTREAKDILMASGMAEEEAHSLAMNIEGSDPYKNAGRLFTPVIAKWLLSDIESKINVHFDAYTEYILKYKDNRKKLTNIMVPREYLEKKKELLGKKIENFTSPFLKEGRYPNHDSIEFWNMECSNILNHIR